MFAWVHSSYLRNAKTSLHEQIFGNKISFHYIHESCNLVGHRHENGDVLSM
jgi:hypothetical protein